MEAGEARYRGPKSSRGKEVARPARASDATVVDRAEEHTLPPVSEKAADPKVGSIATKMVAPEEGCSVHVRAVVQAAHHSRREKAGPRQAGCTLDAGCAMVEVRVERYTPRFLPRMLCQSSL